MCFSLSYFVAGLDKGNKLRYANIRPNIVVLPRKYVLQPDTASYCNVAFLRIVVGMLDLDIDRLTIAIGSFVYSRLDVRISRCVEDDLALMHNNIIQRAHLHLLQIGINNDNN